MAKGRPPLEPRIAALEIRIGEIEKKQYPHLNLAPKVTLEDVDEALRATFEKHGLTYDPKWRESNKISGGTYQPLFDRWPGNGT